MYTVTSVPPAAGAEVFSAASAVDAAAEADAVSDAAAAEELLQAPSTRASADAKIILPVRLIRFISSFSSPPLSQYRLIFRTDIESDFLHVCRFTAV